MQDWIYWDIFAEVVFSLLYMSVFLWEIKSGQIVTQESFFGKKAHLVGWKAENINEEFGWYAWR